MERLHTLKYYLRHMTGSLILLGVLVYFSYHLISGHRGYLSLKRVEAQQVKLQKDLDRIVVEREELENRVSLLRPTSLDRDMLEERSHVMLGYVHPDDVIVIEH